MIHRVRGLIGCKSVSVVAGITYTAKRAAPTAIRAGAAPSYFPVLSAVYRGLHMAITPYCGGDGGEGSRGAGSAAPSMPIAFSNLSGSIIRHEGAAATDIALKHRDTGLSLIFSYDRVLMSSATKQPLRLSVAEVRAWCDEASTEPSLPVLLGHCVDRDHPLFALDIHGSESPTSVGGCRKVIQAAVEAAGHGQCRFVDMRSLAMAASSGDSSLATLGRARSLLGWHATAEYCARCGGMMEPSIAGEKRQCDACRAELFPRLDAIAIAAVTAGTGDDLHVLLGRSPHFPKAMYSALAGFMEPGETIEEAAAREIREETGVVVAPSDVTYQMSQPWPLSPMGAQLMLGCTATVPPLPRDADGNPDTWVRFDADELEEARWFHRDEVIDALDRVCDPSFQAGAAESWAAAAVGESSSTDEPLWVPGPMAVAHHIIARAVGRE